MNSLGSDGFDVVNVIGEYFQLCDVKDWDTLRSLWTDVVTVEYGGIIPLKGKSRPMSLCAPWPR
jgi:hypothetical protein